MNYEGGGEAPALVKTHFFNTKKCFYLIFTREPINPIKNTSFALGMRRACVLARMVQRTEAKRSP
jgi:hypothetical protein